MAWGSYGKDEPGAACQLDGQANTTALLVSEHSPPVQLLRGADANLQGLYLPALRELKTLFANGCDQFDPDRWYWSARSFPATTPSSRASTSATRLNLVRPGMVGVPACPQIFD